MARIETTYAKCLYFCGVKSQRRHEVAGSASVFRATILSVNNYLPDECGRSNAHKVSAFENVIARIGVLYCQNSNVMKDNEKKLQDAQQKTVESIQEYLNDFHSVSELYERTAKAQVEIVKVSNHLSDEAKKLIGDMADDHICLLNLLKPLEEKGE
jgi:uncharacterized membrane-anchored protein YhcB (DUF1043 family)